MTAKDVLLLLRHRYQSPLSYLDAEIFFGFSNSEFINNNTFSLKDNKKRYRDFNGKCSLKEKMGMQRFARTV